MITVESKVIVGQMKGLRVILSSLVLEELGKRLFNIYIYIYIYMYITEISLNISCL